jgi:hypothetical protein
MIYNINFNYKPPEDALVINTTSRSTNWSRGLSPFFLGPIDLYGNYKSQNIENAWQYSKVYEYFTNDDKEPNESYFKWAEEGWNSKKAERYPMGRGVKPLYSYWDGVKMNYIEARKNIYVPLYAKAVKETLSFKKLKSLYESNENIYLIDFDAHNLEPKTFKYIDLLNNENLKFGHGYVLSMLLEGEI